MLTYPSINSYISSISCKGNIYLKTKKYEYTGIILLKGNCVININEYLSITNTNLYFILTNSFISVSGFLYPPRPHSGNCCHSRTLQSHKISNIKEKSFKKVAQSLTKLKLEFKMCQMLKSFRSRTSCSDTPIKNECIFTVLLKTCNVIIGVLVLVNVSAINVCLVTFHNHSQISLTGV